MVSYKYLTMSSVLLQLFRKNLVTRHVPDDENDEPEMDHTTTQPGEVLMEEDSVTEHPVSQNTLKMS